MQRLDFNIKEDLSLEWKHKYAAFVDSAHWPHFVDQFNRYLVQNVWTKPLPYFDQECSPPLFNVMQYFKQAYQGCWAEVLEAAPFDYLLLVIGQRQTSATLKDELGIPPYKSDLLQSCDELYNKEISIAARAWEKHIGRNSDDFWGKSEGNSRAKNLHVKSLVKRLIEEQTWWNIFYHYKHERVYELRVASGHGIRWSMKELKIIGFLEPFINENE